MKTLSPKGYQTALLASVEKYFRACREYGDAKRAFHNVMLDLWGQPGSYQQLSGFEEGMPYFCLRVPTGGGKTRIGAQSVPLVNRYLLQNDRSVILWLVPSGAILEQTLKAFSDREHPYHADLSEAGPIKVVALEKAKSLTRADYDTATVVIVATSQSFRQREMDNLKVYEDSGELMSHFGDLSPEQRERLLKGKEGVIPRSFANVLRLRRPFLVIDEAHNARTPLAFDTLARFAPSGILELTATPATKGTPSNVLHSVSAGELKTEQMIKLPIVLETEPDWQKVLAYAIDKRNQLQILADREHLEGDSYLRPLVLIQSQPRREGVETLDADRLKQELIENHHIPEQEIAIATGEQRDLEGLDLFSPTCPIKFIITQKALAEGWDCSFAYVLASMANLHGETAVEQLLGRILRQPEAKTRRHPELNKSYAFVASRDFGETAAALRDRLVEGAGFEKADAWDFVAAGRNEQAALDLHVGSRIVIHPIEVSLPETPDLSKLDAVVRAKVQWNSVKQTLTITKPLAPEEGVKLATTVLWDASQTVLAEAAKKSRTEAIELLKTPSERGLDFRIPLLAVWINGELQLFDDPEVLDYPWELPAYQAVPTEDELSLLRAAERIAEGGEIDVEEGKVMVRFLSQLERDLALSYIPENWTEAALAGWFCRNLRENGLTHQSKMVFVSAFLRSILQVEGVDLSRVNRQKFLLRSILESKIRGLRREAVQQAYQQFLFTDGVGDRAKTACEYELEFHPDCYAPDRDYPRAREFARHYYPRVADFDSGEEEDCAWFLDRMAQQGKIEFWVRNLVRKASSSFFLPTATGRFYPDFICKLPDQRFLVVEYKGADRWESAKPDRDIGELWAELSGGKCAFVMVKDKRWDWIEAKLSPATGA